MTDASPAVIAVADHLERARHTGRPVSPIRDLLAPDDVGAAYAAQQIFSGRRLAAGARVAGRKIGLTSPAVQQQLGVDQPDFGVLFHDMQVADGAAVDLRHLLQPRIEGEVAFVLGADLDSGELTPAACGAAVEYASAALEIVDSRIWGWDIGIVDTIADNASSGLFVLGTRRVPLAEVTPREVEMSMTADGRVVSEGTGIACLGDPLAALAWLARTARELGDPLRAGQVVLSGALGPMHTVTRAETIRADISSLGSVSVRFIREES